MIALVVIVALLALMWVVMIRPQRRRQADQAQMMSDLAIGDDILTAGGIYGTVDEIGADDVTVEIAPGTKIRIAKRAVAAVIPDEEEEAEEDEPEAEDEADEEPEEAAVSAENPTSAGEKRR